MIYVYGSLTIGTPSNSGSITLETADNDSQDSYCVYATESVTTNGGTLNINAGGATGSNSSYGIFAQNEVNLTKGAVKVYGGSDEATNHSIYGVYSNGTISIGTEGSESNNDLSLNIIVNQAEFNSVGIYLNTSSGKAISINSGLINIIAKGFIDSEYNVAANCIYSGGAINLPGGILELYAAGQADNNCTMHAAGNNQIINMDVGSFEIDN